jgi:hypothetical protein
MPAILRITNVNTCSVWNGDNDGKGNLWTTISKYNPPCQEYFLQPYQNDFKNGFKIVSLSSGYFAHGDNNGTGNLWLNNVIDDACQVFFLERGPTPFPSWRIVNKSSGYFANADNDGTGNLWLHNVPNDASQLFMFFSRDDDPLRSDTTTS